MKAARFEYHSPTTVDEVVSLLTDLDNAELVAGNQSLAIAMNLRLATPDHLIDLNNIAELAYIEERSDGIEIGAMTRHRTIAKSALLQSKLPALSESAGEIAGPSVRNMGTLGGSIGEADPAGNYPTVLVALDASLRLTSMEGERTIPIKDFFVGFMTTDLRENEIITSATVDTGEFPMERSGMSFQELKTVPYTWPKLSAAGAIRVDDSTAEEPIIEEARVALGNVADVTLRERRIEEAVIGEPLSSQCLEEAAIIAMDASTPTDELHADADYKEEMVGVYTRRVLQRAYERARA